MYISKVKLHNFRGFKGDHEFTFKSGINFLVGNNNCGKTSLFRAVEFIQSGKEIDSYITKDLNIEEFVSVEMELAGGDLDDFINSADSLRKYKQYIIENDGLKVLRIARSSEETEIIQNKKPKTLTIKNVRVFNPKTDQYENPVGIDNTVGALFETQFVWADINIEDVADVSKTKICGRIINGVINSSNESWEEFAKAHAKAFDDIRNQLEPIEQTLKNKMSEQYGDTEIKFNFSLPELSDFLKFGTINLSDDGIQTMSSEKGTGMQRALALAIIQVYAEIASKISDDVTKPLIFFLDEPETFLHPEAQSHLLEALGKIAQSSQIFIATHSPYMLRSFKSDGHTLYSFSKHQGVNNAKASIELNLFGKSSPTWGEINYRAFNVVSYEFHDELYGFIQAHAIDENEDYYKPKNFDQYLCQKNPNFTMDRKYKHLKSDGSISEYDTTIATYIRNVIHHPENRNNAKISTEDLERSIGDLLLIMEDINK